MSQHTPGPWALGHTDGIGQVGLLFVRDSSGCRVADCEAERDPDNGLKFERSLPEDMANARLIAAAPDLLAALKAVTEVMAHYIYPKPDVGPEHPWAVLQSARAAIAKAEGAIRRADAPVPPDAAVDPHDGDTTA